MAGAGRRGRRAPPPRTTYGATREDATRPRALESFRASESQIGTPVECQSAASSAAAAATSIHVLVDC
uniref:Uncharacterized protein n=1 Tax=Oryza nivara TaxID=4536 RepID=A0A0E0HUI7_ORYNI